MQNEILIILTLTVIKSIDGKTLIDDIKLFCDGKPKINFCSDYNFKISRAFQPEYDQMINFKVYQLQLKHNKELQKMVEFQNQQKKEKELKSKILKEYYKHFRERYY